MKSAKIIATLGVAAGLGVALLPLATYAVDPSDATEGTVVKVKVSDSIAVEVTAENYTDSTNAIVVAQGEENVNGLIHTVNVKGNTRNDYNLYVSGKDGKTDLQHKQVTGAKIPTLSADAENLTAGSWGYQYSGIDNETYNGTWKKVQGSVGAAAAIHTAGSARTGNYDENYKVKYGVKAAPNQLSGEYEATVVYTATAAEV